MSARLVLATTIFVALSASAYADGLDGVSITHAKALAGNVTPGDTAGYPVTLSQPGLYKFAGNLDVPAVKTGIEVTVADVTIDLNGYRLHAFGRPNTTGIYSTQPSITIRNGTIAGFTVIGIQAAGLGALTWIIEDMRIAVNGTGIHASLSDRTIIRNNEIASNGLGLYCGKSCLIEGNIVSSNTRHGVVATSGLVLNNSVFSNGQAGILNDAGGTDLGSTGNVVFGNNPNFSQPSGSTDRNWCGFIC
jgi:parallel beta-helix repeat protein